MNILYVNYKKIEVCYSTLRTVCGEHTLQELLEQRAKVSDVIEEFVFKQVKNW